MESEVDGRSRAVEEHPPPGLEMKKDTLFRGKEFFFASGMRMEIMYLWD